jgi:hypothetical protein
MPIPNEAISVCCRLATGAGCSANRGVAGARIQCNNSRPTRVTLSNLSMTAKS